MAGKNKGMSQGKPAPAQWSTTTTPKNASTFSTAPKNAGAKKSPPKSK